MEPFFRNFKISQFQNSKILKTNSKILKANSKILLLCLFVLSITLSSNGQNKSLLGGVKDILNKVKPKNASSLSSDEIIQGLKEALTVGANKSTTKLSTVDGFFKDAAVKILLPEQVQKIEKKMRAFGMGKLVDNAILSMNRAAEDASKSAAPIFISAIKNITITDGLNILRGKDTAATAYLRTKTTDSLTNAFRPVIESSLEKVDATKYWKELFTVYNRFSKQPVNTDLAEYVTERSLKGIFYYVADEEKKIRKDPAARATDILKKVFSSK